VFSDPEYWARSFSWSADGSRLYRITGEDEVAVWNTATWTEVEFPGGAPVGVSAIDNPLGGSYTAVTHSDGTVRLLDPTTGEEQNLISGLLETGQGSLVEFSSDGTLMMSVVDSTARLWDPPPDNKLESPW